MSQQPEYIEWPGSATFPGDHTFPGWDDRADGSSTVHAHNLAEWTESTNPLEMAVTRLAQATTESAVVRMQNAMGGVNFFYDSTVDDTDLPPMQGEHVGDVAFGKDHDTGIVYHQYRWDGSAWNAVQVDSEMIANLDVGKLTAGRADINDLVAQRIAAASGKFVELDVGNLTATGTSTIDDLTSERIWSSVVAAKAVQADQITGDMIAANSIDARKIVAGAVTADQLAADAVTADKIATNAVTADAIKAGAVTASALTADAINGKTITGATIIGSTVKTSTNANTGIVLDASGIHLYNSTSHQQTGFMSAGRGDVQVANSDGNLISVSDMVFGGDAMSTAATTYVAKPARGSDATGPWTSVNLFTWKAVSKQVFCLVQAMAKNLSSGGYRVDPPVLANLSIVDNSNGWVGDIASTMSDGPSGSPGDIGDSLSNRNTLMGYYSNLTIGRSYTLRIGFRSFNTGWDSGYYSRLTSAQVTKITAFKFIS